MAVHLGKEGEVKVGSNTVAELLTWSLTESAELIETTNLAATSRTYMAGRTTGSGNLTCHWDETDTSAQGAMVKGASLTLNMYPEGSGSGATFATFTALFETVEKNGEGTGVVGANISFTVSGDVTWGTA
jgi:hypothetical protein